MPKKCSWLTPYSVSGDVPNCNQIFQHVSIVYLNDIEWVMERKVAHSETHRSKSQLHVWRGNHKWAFLNHNYDMYVDARIMMYVAGLHTPACIIIVIKLTSTLIDNLYSFSLTQSPFWNKHNHSQFNYYRYKTIACCTLYHFSTTKHSNYVSKPACSASWIILMECAYVIQP